MLLVSLLLLDADDLWTPDKLEAQLAALQENPPAVAYSWVDRIDESSQFYVMAAVPLCLRCAELLLRNFLV